MQPGKPSILERCSIFQYFAVPIEVSLGDAAGVPARGLLKLLQTEKNADLSFMVEGKVVRAHRVIVASQCDYFDRLEVAGHAATMVWLMCVVT